MLTAWLGELITKEELGNGSSMILFMNIASGLPSNLTQFSFDNLSSIKNLSALFISYLVYFGRVWRAHNGPNQTHKMLQEAQK